MKLFTLVFALFMTFAASASELASTIPLYKIKDAYRYDVSSLSMEYSAYYGGIILSIQVLPEYGIPSHPEMNTDIFMAKIPELTFDGKAFIVTKDSGEEAICAVVTNNRINDMGTCNISPEVIGETISVSLKVR
jgi:hypothetical protein